MCLTVTAVKQTPVSFEHEVTYVPRISLNSNIFLMSSTCFFQHFPESPFSRAMVQIKPGEAVDASDSFDQIPRRRSYRLLLLQLSHTLNSTPLWLVSTAATRIKVNRATRRCSLAGCLRWKCHLLLG